MQLVDDEMHWQFGGNFEPVKIVCELDWKQCPAALANYIWTEIVTDVIECLNSEGLIWRVLAVLVVCVLLGHFLYSKTRWRNENAVNRRSLNKVGYKVQDLELKVNILTYKMQYGTWPLPHQIRQRAFRKELRNLRLTLSSSDHRNAWIKQLLISPLHNNSCISYPKFDPRSTKNFSDFFNVETGRTSSDTQHGISAIDCSASKSSKTSIDNNSAAQPTTKHSQRSRRSSEKVDLKQHGVSTSENSVLGRRTRKHRGENDELPVRPQSQRRYRRQSRFTRTIDECKKYLKELRYSNRNLGLASSASELSDASSVRTERNNAQTILRPSREISDMSKFENRRERRPAKYVKNSRHQKGKFLEEEEEVKGSLENDLNASNGISSMKKIVSKKVLPPTLNITFHANMFPRDPSIEELASILASSSPQRDEKSTTTSKETLHQVKTRLESLQNVLKNYEAKDSKAKALRRSNRNEEKVKNICKSVAATLKSMREEIDRMYESRSSAVTFEVDADEPEEKEGYFRNRKRTRAICFDVKDQSKGADYGPDAINFHPEKQDDKSIDDENVSPNSLCSSNILQLCQRTFAMNFHAEKPDDADYFLDDLPLRSSRCYETNTKYLQTCFDTDFDKNEEDCRSPTSFKGFGSYSDAESHSLDASEKAAETTMKMISEENGSEFSRSQEIKGRLEERVRYAFSTDSCESGIYRSVPVLEELQEVCHGGSSRNTGRSKFSENAGKSDGFSDEISKYPVPMETDEDVFSLSHASSQSDTTLDTGKKATEIINEENNTTGKSSQEINIYKDVHDDARANSQYEKIEEQSKSDEYTKITLDNLSVEEQMIVEVANCDPKRISQFNKVTDKSNNEGSSANEKVCFTNRCPSSSSLDNVKNLEEELPNSKHQLESTPSEYFSSTNLRGNFPRVGNINELVLRSAKSIKNYTDIFSQKQNQAIHETRKAIEDRKETKDEAAGYPENERKNEYSGNERNSVGEAEGNPNLTLKRHRGMFSIAEEILPKTDKEVFGKFGTWEQKGVKRKRIDRDDIDVIHRSPRIKESNQDLSCLNFRPTRDNLSVNVEKLKFRDSKDSFDSSWKNILCAGISDLSITDDKRITEEPDKSFIGRNSKEDDEKDVSIEKETFAEKNEASQEINNENVFSNYRSVFASHCSSPRFVEETPNFNKNNSANSDDHETQVCRETNKSVFHNEGDNDLELKNKDIKNNISSKGEIQNSDPVYNLPIGNDIVLPVKYIKQEPVTSNCKGTERTDCPSKMEIESESLSSNINAGSTTSGSYIDASSHDLIAASKVNFEKFLAKKTEKLVINSPQCPSATSLPRRNNVTWMSRTQLPFNSLRRQETGTCRLRARSNSNLSSATNPTNRRRDSSEELNNRPSRSNVNVVCQKRSRSYVTPRKSESSPRYSNVVQKEELKTKCDLSRERNRKVCSAGRKIESSQQSKDDLVFKSESSEQRTSSARGKEEKLIDRKENEGKEKGDDEVSVNLCASESSPQQVSSAKETIKESIHVGLRKSASSSQQTCSKKSAFSSRQSNSQIQSGIKSRENGNLDLEGKSKSRTPSRSHIPVLKVTSKSSIPILKGRLDSARKSEREVRPRSPVRGPLTMTMMWNENERVVSENQKETAVCAEGTQLNKGNEEVAENCSAKGTQVVKDSTANEMQVNAMQISKSYAQGNGNHVADGTGLRSSTAKSTQVNRNVVVETVQISKECSTESTQVNKSLFVEAVDANRDHSTESMETNKIDVVERSRLSGEHFTEVASVNSSSDKKVKSEEKDKTEYPEKCEGNENCEPATGPVESPKMTSNLLSSTSTSQEKMVIYVNILTKHDNNVTRIVDPKKFMEYIKSRENEKEITSGSCDEDFLRRDGLCKTVVKSSWPTTEQKETDVTAKPSVTETSTSISDLQPAATDILKTAERFQVFGMPQELTNEEYVVLLDALNQGSNVLHLQEIQNLCSTLETNARHSE